MVSGTMSTLRTKAKIAANNNADLCAAIMAAHGLRTTRTTAAYLCIDDPLPYYPKMVTLDEQASAEVMSRLQHSDAQDIRTIKDSFSCLDAKILGMKTLFEASWIWHDAIAQDLPPNYLPPNWIQIQTAKQLANWHQAWGGDNPTERVIFPPACLNDANLTFLARLSGTEIHAGCIANLSKDAIGLSNVFSQHPNDTHLYQEALAAVSAMGGPRPVVGYESGQDLVAARASGFQEVGRLRVLGR